MMGQLPYHMRAAGAVAIDICDLSSEPTEHNVLLVANAKRDLGLHVC